MAGGSSRDRTPQQLLCTCSELLVRAGTLGYARPWGCILPLPLPLKLAGNPDFESLSLVGPQVPHLYIHVPTLCDEVMRCVQCGARWHCDGWMLLLLLLMMIASWWPGQKAREPVGHVTPGAFFLSGSQRPLPQAPCVPSPVLALFTLSHSTGQHCPSQSPLDQASLFPFYRRKTGFKGEAARRTLTTKLFTAVPLKE